MRVFRNFFVSSLLTVGLVACTHLPARKLQNLPIASEVDTFVESVLSEINLPVGLGVAVYTRDGVYTRGFGQANIKTGEPVTADTAFYIASSTKSFTALAMNILHHRGIINLDSTLAEFAPQAAFPNDIQPDRVTLRDLLTHTSGIENAPIAMRSAYTGEHTPGQVWDLLRVSRINQKAPLGKFQYTNTDYNILTVLTDRKLGVPWQQIIAREIVKPAGMQHTTAYVSQARQKGWSEARPYIVEGGGRSLQPLYLEKTDATMQSAGGMIMSASDALLWLELLTRDGRVGNKQIVPTEVVRETRQRLAKVNRTFNGYLREDYGLGWYVSSYNGDLMLQHFGSFSGFRAHVSYLPERGVGVAVFSNELLTGTILPDAIANFVYDRLAGREVDMADRVKKLTQKFQARANAYTKDLEKRAGRKWALSLPKKNYAGKYVSPLMGTVNIELIGDGLRASIGLLHAVAEPFPGPDTIRVALIPPGGDVIFFDVKDNTVKALKLFNTRFVRESN